MMMSPSLRREEEAHVTAKNLKQAESPTCTKTRTTFLPTSLIYKFTTHCYPHNQQAYLPSSSYTGMVLSPSRCDKLSFTMLFMPDSQRLAIVMHDVKWVHRPARFWTRYYVITSVLEMQKRL